MRVVALTTSYPKHPSDPTAPFIRSISHGLQGHGLEVDLVLPHHHELEWEGDDPPVRLHPFRYLPRGWHRGHVWGYAGALRADTALRPRALAVLPAAAVTCTVRLHRVVRRLAPRAIHAHWLLPNGPLAALVARRTGTPLVVSLHGSGVFLAERHGVLALAARPVLRAAAAVTACSAELAERAIALGADPGRLHVIPYGVDAQRFRPASAEDRNRARRRWEIDERAFTILAVGRLVEKKGFSHLIDAMAKLATTTPRARLRILGDGDLRSVLQARVDRLGLRDRVTLHGSVSREDVQSFHRAADVLAVPSIRDASGNRDGLPNVVLEGMASGLPIVASRAVGIPDVVEDGVSGRLVPERDARALAEALNALASDPGERSRLSAAARRKVEADLRWDRVTGRYADVLRGAATEAAP